MRMPFPEQEQQQNSQTTRECEICSWKPRMISNKAQCWLADRGNNGVHQRIHRNDCRPHIIGYLVLDPVQKDWAYYRCEETDHSNEYKDGEFLKGCQYDQADKNDRWGNDNEPSFGKECLKLVRPVRTQHICQLRSHDEE